MTEPLFYKFQAVSSLAFGGISGTYATVVTAIPEDAVYMCVSTTLDGAVMLSLDGGTSDHLAVTKSANNCPQVIRISPEGGQTYHRGAAIKVKTIEAVSAGSIYITFINKA
jgi:hypothetical protein